MMHQIQPNSASCFLTSLAMCIDVPVEELFKIVGHKGTERAFPLEVPRCYRGFHPCELAYCAYVHGYSFIQFDVFMEQGHEKYIRTYKAPYDIKKLLEGNKAVIITETHAYAWDGAMLFNTNGKFADLKNLKVRSVFLVIPLRL